MVWIVLIVLAITIIVLNNMSFKEAFRDIIGVPLFLLEKGYNWIEKKLKRNRL